MAPRVLISILLLAVVAPLARAAGPNGAQQKGAEAFLAAVATGSPEAVAQELHPDELEKLRSRLLTLLRAEGSQGTNTYRSRLFGPGRSLAQLESATAQKFYAALSDRLRLRARVYEKFDWLAAVPDGKVVYLVGKGEQPKERGSVKVVVMVGLMQYGQQWRAVVPTEIEAQLDDLIEGRVLGRAGAARRRSGAGAAAPAPQPLAPGISELLARAEAALAAGNCQEYYDAVHEPELQSQHFAQRTQDPAHRLHQQREHARNHDHHAAHRAGAAPALRPQRHARHLRRQRPGAAVRALRGRARRRSLVHRGVD